MPKGQLKFYDDFRKGMNDTTSPNQLKDNEMFYAQNVILNERGGFKTRKGTVNINTDALGGNIQNMVEWIIGAEERLVIVRTHPTTNDIEVGLLNNDGSFTAVQVVSISNVEFVILSNKLFIIDSNDEKIYSWGAYDFNALGTHDIVIGDVVLDTDGEFYQSLKDKPSIDLTTEDYTIITDWENVTSFNNVVSTVVKEMNESDDVENDMSPIKKCTMFAFHNESLRIFASGNPENPSAIYYSEFNDFGFFKATSILYPTTSEGKVTAIADFGDSLMVSYANRWYHYQGIDVTTDATWKPLPLNYGCVSHNSLVITPMSMTYLGRNNIHKVDINLVSNQVISLQSFEMINSLTQGVLELLTENIKNKSMSSGIFFEGKYMLAFCDDEALDYNNKILVINWKTKGFAVYSGWQTHKLLSRSNGDLIIASNDYVLKQDDIYNDFDVETGEYKAIELHVVTKNYYMDTFLNPKMLKRFYVVLQQQDEEISSIDVIINGNYMVKTLNEIRLDESMVWEKRYWGSVFGWSDMVIRNAYVEKKANYFNVEIKNNNLNDPITFYAVGFEFEVLQPEREGERYNESNLLE